MKENYRAWDIDIDALITLRDFIKAGILAPSSHNSQPWAFRLRNDFIAIVLESSRRLPASDKNDRQAYISLGCAIANIEIIAAYHGHAVDLVFTDSGAELRFSESKDKNSLPELAQYLTKRATNRSAYIKEPLPTKLRNEAQALVVEGTKLQFVEDAVQIAALAALAVDSSISAMEDIDFREELSRHVLPNTSSHKIGMPGFGLGFPLPISFILPHLIRRTNVAKLSRKQDMALFQKTPTIGIIETKTDMKVDWMNVGRTYERLALLATSMGYATAPWGAPIQTKDFHTHISSTLNLSGRPQMFFRLGRPTKPVPHAPRIPVERVLS
ncbi:hypothetical protein HKL94_01955 [Candidatus Parcubacteria bacterium]|nr:hypothetical protein [Candidatus Parcubacteria bacterium]